MIQISFGIFKLFGAHRDLPCLVKDHDEGRIWSHVGDVTRLLIKDGVPRAPLQNPARWPGASHLSDPQRGPS